MLLVVETLRAATEACATELIDQSDVAETGPASESLKPSVAKSESATAALLVLAAVDVDREADVEVEADVLAIDEVDVTKDVWTVVAVDVEAGNVDKSGVAATGCADGRGLRYRRRQGNRGGSRNRLLAGRRRRAGRCRLAGAGLLRGGDLGERDLCQTGHLLRHDDLVRSRARSELVVVRDLGNDIAQVQHAVAVDIYVGPIRTRQRYRIGGRGQVDRAHGVEHRNQVDDVLQVHKPVVVDVRTDHVRRVLLVQAVRILPEGRRNNQARAAVRGDDRRRRTGDQSSNGPEPWRRRWQSRRPFPAGCSRRRCLVTVKSNSGVPGERGSAAERCRPLR